MIFTTVPTVLSTNDLKRGDQRRSTGNFIDATSKIPKSRLRRTIESEEVIVAVDGVRSDFEDALFLFI